MKRRDTPDTKRLHQIKAEDQDMLRISEEYHNGMVGIAEKVQEVIKRQSLWEKLLKGG